MNRSEKSKKMLLFIALVLIVLLVSIYFLLGMPKSTGELGCTIQNIFSGGTSTFQWKKSKFHEQYYCRETIGELAPPDFLR